VSFPAQAPVQEIEVWANTAAGKRYYVSLDITGREIHKVVNGKRTFSITSFERQLNQERAADTDLDMFRNGTFVLQREAEGTNKEEVSSPNSYTDKEIDQLVRDSILDKDILDSALEKIDSSVTIGRIMDSMVIEDAPAELVATTRAAWAKIDPSAAVPEREIVVTTPDTDDEWSAERG